MKITLSVIVASVAASVSSATLDPSGEYPEHLPMTESRAPPPSRIKGRLWVPSRANNWSNIKVLDYNARTEAQDTSDDSRNETPMEGIESGDSVHFEDTQEGREDFSSPLTGPRLRCLSRRAGHRIAHHWMEIFSGIPEDHLEIAGKLLIEEFELYSQTSDGEIKGRPCNVYRRWTTHAPDVNESPKYHPFLDKEDFIESLMTESPIVNTFTMHPVIVGCHGIAIYWHGVITADTEKGRINGIDMLLLEPGQFMIREAWSEWNIEQCHGSGD